MDQELINKLHYIARHWEYWNQDLKDKATNSAAFNLYKGREEMAGEIAKLIKDGEERINRIYNNLTAIR